MPLFVGQDNDARSGKVQVGEAIADLFGQVFLEGFAAGIG